MRLGDGPQCLQGVRKRLLIRFIDHRLAQIEHYNLNDVNRHSSCQPTSLSRVDNAACRNFPSGDANHLNPSGFANCAAPVNFAGFDCNRFSHCENMSVASTTDAKGATLDSVDLWRLPVKMWQTSFYDCHSKFVRNFRNHFSFIPSDLYPRFRVGLHEFRSYLVNVHFAIDGDGEPSVT